MKVIWLSALLLITACSQTKYWVKDSADLQQTAADLSACRIQATKSVAHDIPIYSGFQMEAPCMGAKGYGLSDTPPPKKISK